MAEHAHTITVTRAEMDLIREALALKVAEIDQGLASIRRTERVTSADARAIFPGDLPGLPTGRAAAAAVPGADRPPEVAAAIAHVPLDAH